MKRIIFLILVITMAACTNNTNKDAATIHREILTIDSHTDTPLWFTRSDFDLAEKHDPMETRSRVDFPRMKEGGLDAIFMAAFVGQGERTDSGNIRAKNRIDRILDSIHSNVDRYPELAEIALSPDDAPRLESKDKIAVYIGIENGYPLGSDIANMQEFYDKGARYITLCHTKNNDICDSSTDSLEHGGLSNLGEEVVREMNRLGIMIDVSHASDSSFYDVIALSKDPIIASHSCARALCDHPRNLSDEMLKVLADKEGVIQVCLLSAYLKEPAPNPQRDSAFDAVREKYNHFRDLTEEEHKKARKEWYATDRAYPQKLATVSDLVDHIDHIVEVAGIDHVGIGSDFDGGGGLADCYDVSQMANITEELLRRDYSVDEIQKIWSGNFMRVFNEVNK